MCEDHGPKPRMLDILDARDTLEVTADDTTVARFISPYARLPVVAYPSGHTDCVLGPPEPVSWTEVGEIPVASRVSFCSNGQRIPVTTTTASGERLLAGRNAAGALVRLRIAASA